ncbi:MAG TPA: class IV adenylate cyclase [Methylomirabilota bacterium]
MGDRRPRPLRLRSSRRTIVLAELKARCDDLAAVRAQLRGRARHERTVRQIDTYFVVSRGRLKLREARGTAQLIYYERPNLAAAKRSDVVVVPVRADGALRALLEQALGVRAMVAKTRESWRWRGVQVLLDTVDGLGTFVELKKVVRGRRALTAASRELTALRQQLGLAAAAVQARSYGDLLARRRRRYQAPPNTS